MPQAEAKIALIAGSGIGRGFLLETANINHIVIVSDVNEKRGRIEKITDQPVSL